MDVNDSLNTNHLVNALTSGDPMQVPGALLQRSPLDQSLMRRNDRPQAPMGNRYADADELLTRPSPSLDPRVITALPGYDDDTKGVVAGAVAALEGLQTAMSEVIAARSGVVMDPTLNEAAQVLKVSDFAQSKFDKATARYDAAYKALHAASEVFEAEFRKPVAYAATGQFTAEVRAYARSLPTGERLQFLNEALERKDVIALGAVLGAPHYLSGVSPQLQEAMIERYNRQRDPVAFKRLEFVREVLERVRRAGTAFTAGREGAIGTRYSTVHKLRAQQALASRAFGNGETA